MFWEVSMVIFCNWEGCIAVLLGNKHPDRLYELSYCLGHGVEWSECEAAGRAIVWLAHIWHTQDTHRTHLRIEIVSFPTTFYSRVYVVNAGHFIINSCRIFEDIVDGYKISQNIININPKYDLKLHFRNLNLDNFLEIYRNISLMTIIVYQLYRCLQQLWRFKIFIW